MIMRRGLNKRGLTPIVASVLLIFLVLILASVVFLWARGFIAEQLEKGGEAVENQCLKVAFRAELAANYQGAARVDVDFSNEGDVKLYAVSVKEVGGDGNEEAKLHLLNLDKGSAKRLELELSSSVLEELVIYPVLLAGVVGKNENKEFTCLDNPNRMTL